MARGCYLEDHPRTCKWLISMVIVATWDPFQMGFPGLINRGDPNYLLSGMILQVPSLKLTASLPLKIDRFTPLKGKEIHVPTSNFQHVSFREVFPIIVP